MEVLKYVSSFVVSEINIYGALAKCLLTHLFPFTNLFSVVSLEDPLQCYGQCDM